MESPGKRIHLNVSWNCAAKAARSSSTSLQPGASAVKSMSASLSDRSMYKTG